MKRLHTLILFLSLGNFASLSAQQATFMELEMKFNPRLGRVAGTLRLHLQGEVADGTWQLPQGLEVDKVLVNEQKVEVLRQPAGFSIPSQESQSRVQRIQVVFFGSPDREVARFFQDRDGQPWIRLADQDTEQWHPMPPLNWRLPDSVWTAFVLPEGMRPVVEGRFHEVSEWPGGHRRWVHQLPVSELVAPIHIGNYVRFSQLRQASGALSEWEFWVPQSRLEQAQMHYAQVPVMINVLAEEWGEPILTRSDQTWVEWPGAWIAGPPGSNPEELLMHDLMMKVAGLWLGSQELTAQSPIRAGMFQYANWCWIRHQSGEEAALSILEAARNNPAQWSFWLMHDLIDSHRSLWMSQQRGFFYLLKDDSVSEMELRDWISRRIDADRMIVFEQYLDAQEMPLLECELDRRRRKWVLSYRWVGALPEFIWPVEIEFSRERMVVIPQRRKQEISWSTRQGRSYSIDQTQGLFEIRSQ